MIKINAVIRCITVAVLLLTGVMLIMMGMTSNAYSSGFQWRHFGAAPFAKTRAVAMQKRYSAFLALGIPQGAVQLLIKATEMQSQHATLVVGQKLDAMISKGGKVYHDVTIAFGSPVPHMQYAAPSEKWAVTWKGIVYTVYLPEICHNWSLVTSPVVTQNVSQQPQCASATFYVKKLGDQVRFAVITDGSRLPSNCWSLSDGGIVSAAPSPCSVCNWEGPLSVLPSHLKVEYSGLYTAHGHVQTLRFPVEVKGFYIALCVISTGLGESDSWIIPPHAWKGISTVHIPYAKWPVWGPAAITYGRN